MANGFFKKVFSFGKKEVEERPSEDEPLAPINWAALNTLKEAPTTSLPLEGRDRSAKPIGVGSRMRNSTSIPHPLRQRLLPQPW